MISKNDKTLLLMMGNGGAYPEFKEFATANIPKVAEVFGENLYLSAADTQLSTIVPISTYMAYHNIAKDPLNLPDVMGWRYGGGTDEPAVLRALAEQTNDYFKNVIFVCGTLTLDYGKLPEDWMKSRNVIGFHYVGEKNFYADFAQEHQQPKFGHLFYEDKLRSLSTFNEFLASVQ